MKTLVKALVDPKRYNFKDTEGSEEENRLVQTQYCQTGFRFNYIASLMCSRKILALLQ